MTKCKYIAMGIFLCIILATGTSLAVKESTDSVLRGGNTYMVSKNAQLIATNNPPAGWQKHTVLRVNGSSEPLRLPAMFNLVSAPYGHENMQMPSLIYMPEKKRLLMTAEFGVTTSIKTIVITSDDFGGTWTTRRWMHTDANGNPDIGGTVGVTYLGNGVVTASPESGRREFSRDYGETWNESYPIPDGSNGRVLYRWDPVVIDRDKSGNIVRMLEARWNETGYDRNDPSHKYSQAYLWSSKDIGKTWSKEVPIPQWYGVNEVALVRAKNGDIIAGCRTDNPVRFTDIQDMWSGLGISISKDNGKTWSPINQLFEYGRHHPSFVVMPNGHIVMVYIVRAGYTDSKDGFPQFGLEAVISKDNGKSWDLDHKYILAWWTGKVTGPNWWWGLPQSSATVLLPDGSLLTTFGIGFRNEVSQPLCVMDTALVKWRISDKPINRIRKIRNAPFDSELRNKYNPEQ